MLACPRGIINQACGEEMCHEGQQTQFSVCARHSRCAKRSSKKNTDVRQTIEKMFDELSNVKTDRTLLSSLFVEVAKCLSQDVGSKSIKGTVPEPLGGHY